jgi:hypothetical protein
MRRRNRKRKKHNTYLIRVPLAGIIVVGVTVMLGYVGLNQRCDSLGRELKFLEQEHKSLIRLHRQELFKWTQLVAPRQLQAALAEHRIYMDWPSRRQVVQLRSNEISTRPWAYDGAQGYASVNRGTHE